MQVLRLYAPALFEQQVRARAERIRKDKDADAKAAKTQPAARPRRPGAAATSPADELKDPERQAEALHLDKETWQDKLAGIDMGMLARLSRQAATRHVERATGPCSGAAWTSC